MLRLPAITLAGSLVGLSMWLGGAAGLAYLAIYLVTLLPGLPIGWRLFGRGPAGWVSGALIGYGLSAVAFWAPIWLGVAGRVSFAAALIVVSAAVWGLVRGNRPPLVALPVWTPRDTATWLLVLHLVPVFLALPFGRVGESDRSGTKYYRAYFTADFVWHMGLTEELARYDLPPVNPYLAPERMHYYWTYFLVPAAIAGAEEGRLIDVEDALRINALGTALLLFGIVVLAAWGACGRAGPAALAGAVVLIAPSLEGTWELIRLLRAGAPLDLLRETNIDAVTAWPPFRGLRIDGLVRSMWWTPQHAMSVALGMVAMLVATRVPQTLRPADEGPAPSRQSAAIALGAGIALGLSVTMNPFLGAAFCAIYGVCVLLQAVSATRALRALIAHAPVVVPVLGGLAFGIVNRMSEGAGGALSFGWLHLARNAPVATFLLSFGGVLLLVLLAFVPWRGLAWRPAVPAILALGLGVGLMYFVSLVDRAWVGFRAGNLLLATLPMLVARAVAGLTSAGLTSIAVALLVASAAAGLPTTLIDTFNAQDIANRRMGPGFLWTIPITSAQQAGFNWVRAATPPTAIVQVDPIVRGRQNWSLIPSFAGRRMAAGMPISLLDTPEYRGRSDRVHALIASLPVDEAHVAARELGIDYLWLDHDDAAERSAAEARLAARPDLFPPAFRQGEVAIYRVAPRPNR
jgi:hypothetical protein